MSLIHKLKQCCIHFLLPSHTIRSDVQNQYNCPVPSYQELVQSLLTMLGLACVSECDPIRDEEQLEGAKSFGKLHKITELQE